MKYNKERIEMLEDLLERGTSLKEALEKTASCFGVSPATVSWDYYHYRHAECKGHYKKPHPAYKNVRTGRRSFTLTAGRSRTH